MLELKTKCVLDPKTHLFNLSLEAGENCIDVQLPYEEYFGFVKYLGEIAVKYQESLKGKPKPKPRKPRAKK